MGYIVATTAKRISLLYSKINTLDDTLSMMSRYDIDVAQHVATLAYAKTRLDLVNAYMELHEMEARLAAADDIDTVISVRDKAKRILEAYAADAEHNDMLLHALTRKAGRVLRAVDDKINEILSSTMQDIHDLIAELREMEEEIAKREQL